MECHAGQAEPAPFQRTSAAGQAEAQVVEPDFGPQHAGEAAAQPADGGDAAPGSAAAERTESQLTPPPMVQPPVDLELEDQEERASSDCKHLVTGLVKLELAGLEPPVALSEAVLVTALPLSMSDAGVLDKLPESAGSPEWRVSVSGEPEQSRPSPERETTAAVPAAPRAGAAPLNGVITSVTDALQHALQGSAASEAAEPADSSDPRLQGSTPNVPENADLGPVSEVSEVETEPCLEISAEAGVETASESEGEASDRGTTTVSGYDFTVEGIVKVDNESLHQSVKPGEAPRSIENFVGVDESNSVNRAFAAVQVRSVSGAEAPVDAVAAADEELLSFATEVSVDSAEAPVSATEAPVNNAEARVDATEAPVDSAEALVNAAVELTNDLAGCATEAPVDPADAPAEAAGAQEDSAETPVDAASSGPLVEGEVISAAEALAKGPLDATEAPVDAGEAPVDARAVTEGEFISCALEPPVDTPETLMDTAETQMDVTEATKDVADGPVDATKAPVDAAEAPVDAVEALVDAAETPVDAAEAPVDAAEATVDAAEAPVDAAEGPVDATEAPVDAAEAPVDPAEAPVDATETPVDAAETPVDAAEVSVDATEVPVDATEVPVDATEVPVDATEVPVDANEAPVDATETPVDATEAPVDAAEAPVDAAEASVDATEAPVDAAEAPVDAAEAPVDATEAPVDATEAPVDAAEAPMDAAEAPVDAAEAPVDAAEAAAFAVEGPVHASEATVDAAEATVDATEVTANAAEAAVDAAEAPVDAAAVTEGALGSCAAGIPQEAAVNAATVIRGEVGELSEEAGSEVAPSRDCRSPGLEKSASCPVIDDLEGGPALRRRRVSFPEGGVPLVTGYIEPRNPLTAMYNASPEMIAAAYRQSCQKHNCQPLPGVLRQIAALPLLGDRVESFCLRGLRLERSQCESLEEVLKKVQFGLVDLSGCSLDDDSAAALFEMVEFYDSALSVNFGGNRLGVRGWQAACRMIKASPSLERLSAPGIELYDQSAAALGRALRLSHSLRVLHLDGCRLHGRPMALLTAGLRQSPALRELYLAENELGTGDGSMLGNMLKSNLKLDLMDLRANHFDNDSVTFLLDGLAQQAPVSKGDGLVSLNLWYNRFTAKSAGCVAALLARHSTLETINLGRNAVGDDTVCALKASLSSNVGVRRLGLQQCRLSCEAAVALAETLAANTALQRLDLRGNPLGVAGLLALARAMEHNNSLLQLDLGPNWGDTERQQLQSRVRALCDANRQRHLAEQAEEPAPRGDGVPRKLSAGWRRVSLTCDAPAAADAAAAATAAAAAAAASPAAATMKAAQEAPPEPPPPPDPPAEERRRLVSPSPSPSCSPLPRGCRSRFRVFRVNTEPPGSPPAISSSESEASSGSASPSPSPQRRRGFRVTPVTEPAPP